MFIFDCNKQSFYCVLSICFVCSFLPSSDKKGVGVLASERKGAGERESTAFWEKKKTKEWSALEVQQFLQNSPWAKTGTVTVPVKTVGDPSPGESRAVVGAIQKMKIETCCHTFEVTVPGQSAESTTGNLSPGMDDAATETTRAWSFSMRVLWFSSLGVRRAMIRQRELQGVPLGEATAALAPSNDIVLALSGSFLKLLEGLSLEEIKKTSFIKAAKGSKKKLPPTDYVPAQPDADPMAFLIFPKNLEGKPVFTLEDGPVTFAVEGADFKLECQFPLSSMVAEGKLDW